MTGFILFAHGSKVQTANDGVTAVSEQLTRRLNHPVETAFLECAPPTMSDATSTLTRQGVDEIIVVPYFLTMGIHLTRDLPQIVKDLQVIYPTVKFQITEPLEGHPALLEVLVLRSKEAMNARQAY